MVCKIIKKFMDAWSHKFKVGDVLVSLSNYSSRVVTITAKDYTSTGIIYMRCLIIFR